MPLRTNLAQKAGGGVLDHIQHAIKSGNTTEVRIGYFVLLIEFMEILSGRLTPAQTA
jgi:hypothetical protein